MKSRSAGQLRASTTFCSLFMCSKTLARPAIAMLMCFATTAGVHAADNPPAGSSFEWIVGSFEGRIGNSSRFATIAISCDLSRTCKLVYRAATPNEPPYVEVRNFQNVSPSTTLKYVNNALSYARVALRRGSKPTPDTEEAIVQSLALPLLDSDAELEQCIDLNLEPKGGPDAYFVVCKPTRSLWQSPTVLLFGTVLSGCGVAFCRYEIIPLHSALNANKSINTDAAREAAQPGDFRR